MLSRFIGSRNTRVIYHYHREYEAATPTSNNGSKMDGMSYMMTLSRDVAYKWKLYGGGFKNVSLHFPLLGLLSPDTIVPVLRRPIKTQSTLPFMSSEKCLHFRRICPTATVDLFYFSTKPEIWSQWPLAIGSDRDGGVTVEGDLILLKVVKYPDPDSCKKILPVAEVDDRVLTWYNPIFRFVLQFNRGNFTIVNFEFLENNQD